MIINKTKIIFLFLVIGTLALSVYAYRIGNPPKLRMNEQQSFNDFNDYMTNIWQITNGRYSVDVVTSAPSGIAKEGDIKGYYSGSTYRVYLYINGTWRYANLT